MASKKKQDSVSRFTVEGKAYEIDASDLEWGEVEEVEIYFDCPITEVDFDSGRGVMFLAYLARRRKEPSFTLDKARKLKIVDIQGGAPERPTKAASAGAGSRSS